MNHTSSNAPRQNSRLTATDTCQSCLRAASCLPDWLLSAVFPSLLQNRELARKLVELGHKGTVLSKEEFQERREAAEAARSSMFSDRMQPMWVSVLVPKSPFIKSITSILLVMISEQCWSTHGMWYSLGLWEAVGNPTLQHYIQYINMNLIAVWLYNVKNV